MLKQRFLLEYDIIKAIVKYEQQNIKDILNNYYYKGLQKDKNEISNIHKGLEYIIRNEGNKKHLTIGSITLTVNKRIQEDIIKIKNVIYKYNGTVFQLGEEEETNIIKLLTIPNIEIS